MSIRGYMGYKKLFKGLSILAASLGVVILTVFPAITSAQQPATSGNGLKIAPVRNDLTIEPGKSQTVSLFLQNVTSQAVTVRAVANDFVASSNETGEPRLLLDENSYAPVNSFKRLVGPVANVTLSAGERKEVKVSVSVPAKAAGGGYYGAVRFVPVAQSGQGVALFASVGSLFLVKVPGNIVEQLRIESFGAGKGGIQGTIFNSGPLSIITRFKNTGNVHVQPFGKVIVKDMSGKVIQTIEINNTQPRGNVLPASIRRFEDPINKTHLFGRYTVEGNFGYGSNGDLLSAKATFYVIPYYLIFALLILVAALVVGLPRLIRSYNRRIIGRAHGGK